MTKTIAVLAILLLPVVTAGEDLPRGWALYDAVASVHMRAEVTISQKGVVGKASYEYWAEGDKYRIKCASDPSLGLMSDVEYAFNGEYFQFLLRDADTLVIRPEDSKQLPTAIPNPFFLPVNYLDPDDDACPTCALKLRAVKESPKIYRARTKGALPIALRTSDSAIEWLRKDGSIFMSISFDNPLDQGFPRRIALEAFDAQSQRMTQAEFLIRVLEINAAIAPDVFDIPTESASRVWDERNGHAEPRR